MQVGHVTFGPFADPSPESNFASVCAVLWAGDQEPVLLATATVRKLMEHEHEFNEKCLPPALRAVQHRGWHAAATAAAPAGPSAAKIQPASMNKGRRGSHAAAVTAAAVRCVCAV